jgi:hypothetical protein
VFQTIVVLVIVNIHLFFIFILYRHLFKGQFNKKIYQIFFFLHMLISIIAVYEYCNYQCIFKKYSNLFKL